MKREEWLDLARNLDWDFSYVREEDVFPPEVSGRPWLPGSAWRDWDEPYKTTFADYVANQSEKERACEAVGQALGRVSDFKRLPRTWLSGLKLHNATFAHIWQLEPDELIGEPHLNRVVEACTARFGRERVWEIVTAGVTSAAPERRREGDKV